MDDRLYRRPAGQSAFLQTEVIAEGAIHFAEAGDGTLWLVGQSPKRYKGEIRGIDLRHLTAKGRLIAFPIVHSDVTALLVVHGTALWLLESQIGRHGERSPILTRHEWPNGMPETDRMTAKEGLGDSDADAMIEDADGGIWIGGDRELERFRPSALVPLAPRLTGSGWTLCGSPPANLWIASQTGVLMHQVNGRQTLIHGQDLPYKLQCRADGSAWLLDDRGVALVQDTRIHRLPLLAEHGSYSDQWYFTDILETSDHRLIAAEDGMKESRLWEYTKGQWIPFTPGLVGSIICASFEDNIGRIFFGGVKDDIYLVEGKQQQRIPVRGGSVGIVASFQLVGGNLLAVGSEGIAVYKRDAFWCLQFDNPQQAQMGTGMVEVPGGDLWMNGRRGIVRLPAAELREALLHPQHKILGFEVREGDFIGPSPAGFRSASIFRDNSGTLWFATLNGVVSLSPAALGTKIMPPTVEIESADADGRPFADHESLTPHTVSVRIGYVGLSLTRPEDVVYSYKLDGLDRDWQTVGQRTEAVYSRLKPATYRFLVKASYGNGRWTDPVALEWKVLPAYYQTWWFALLCICFCILAVAASICLRLRFVSNLLRANAEQRADERIRIARDLHDTLLQGVQGLMLTFHVAAKSVPEGGGARSSIERALQSADRLLVEGRNRVGELRGSDDADPIDLRTSLKRVGDELAIERGEVFLVTSQGKAVPIKGPVLAELFLVGREALMNAFRHARATTIQIDLHYEPAAFTMICRDDGCGIALDDESLNQRRWGVRGMMERVQRLGGTWRIERAPQSGTLVTVWVPAPQAYAVQEEATSFLARIFGHK